MKNLAEAVLDVLKDYKEKSISLDEALMRIETMCKSTNYLEDVPDRKFVKVGEL